MNEFIDNLPTFIDAIGETFILVFGTLVVSGALGLAIGIALYVTRRGNLLQNRAVFTIVNVLINIVRPVPFIIFAAAIAPLTVAVVGTSIGVQGAVFAMSLSAAFAVARVVEQNLVGVDPGVIEAARAMGAGPWRIIFTVLIPEGLGPLILGYTFVYVGIVDISAQAGAIGGGGLGNYAITYGLQRYNFVAIYVTVGLIIVIVQVGQFVGNWLSRRAMRR